jgi:quinol monooxygenase YgiN
MSELIEATAFISPAPGRIDELRERLRAVVARTVEEPGCLEFRVFELSERPGHFVLWERFADAAALEVAHGSRVDARVLRQRSSGTHRGAPDARPAAGEPVPAG